MAGYTVLTVFENAGTMDEPVIRLPLAGRVSFRQIGIIAGLCIMLPMVIYTGAGELDHLRDGVVSTIGVAGNDIRITWDMVLALVPVPFGLALGLPRPKLVPMDALVVMLVRFMMSGSSVKAVKAKRRKKGRAKAPASRYAGFAKEARPVKPGSKKSDVTYPVSVTDLGVPKSLTITIYGRDGKPLRSRLVRAYIDDELLCSITTDHDGMVGMTFVPRNLGRKRLRILEDGAQEPVVDVVLDVKRDR